MEQQYTCPFCWKDYTRFTIHEHYGCGVEPLETTEEIEQELDAISEEVAIQDSGEAKLDEYAIVPPEEQPKPEAMPEEKAEPKKRGRKPKAVA